MKLNLGCGLNKLEGFVNIDIDSSLNPDACYDFSKGIEEDDDSVEQIVLYHTIEHIPKRLWNGIFGEIYRVLQMDGKFYISFPEFGDCVKNYFENCKGMQEFWEATIYGRQLSPSDFHVSICERDRIKRRLIQCGFKIDYCGPEPLQDFNSLIKCTKVPRVTYEETVWKT